MPQIPDLLWLGIGLTSLGNHDDTSNMDEFELEQLRRHPKWTSVLGVYQQLSLNSRGQSVDFDGWTPRVHDVPEIPNDELPGIHGKLIAFGFLKFDLAGRDGGIRYQLTLLGKTGINASNPAYIEESAIQIAECQETLVRQS